MSASQGAISRRPVSDPRVAVLAALPLVLALLATGVASADPPSGVVRLSAADAARSGTSIRLARQTVRGATLVEVEPSQEGMSLLAVSADGRAAALADRVGELSGALTLAMDDGSQLRIAFPGLLAATFAPDGSWLAVVDGRGALWRLDAATGHRDRVLDGPFVGSPGISDDGSLLLLAVPSVEAPYRSQLVRAVLETGVARPVSDEELVYGAFPLEGGEMAIVAHVATGTVVRRLTSAGERPLLDLGSGAVNVAVSRAGLVAFERAGQGIFLVASPGSPPRGVGIGSRPCFDPAGSALLVRREGQRVALALDGAVLAAVHELAGFAGSEGCLP